MSNSRQPYPELTWQQWRALRLVNETCLLSVGTAAHLLFGTQSAKGRAEELLDELWDLGLVVNMGEFKQYRYMTTEKGDEYIDNALKPTPPLKL